MTRQQRLQDTLQREVSPVHRDLHRPYSSDALRERAAVERSLRFSSDAFEVVLSTPCPVHHTRWGVPCTTTPRGICGPRIEATWPGNSRARDRYGRPAP
jgi:hypothetical protein